jgi:NADH-quinone oxidoreductase subunit M
LGIEYYVGLDGLSLVMLTLAALVVPIALVASQKINENVPLYCGLFLFLQAGLFGAFTALSFFHWFLFWELSLIPAFFLIKLWGGPKRSDAALQFFVYTMVGSIALLLAFLALFLATGTFDFVKLAELARTKALGPAVQAKFAWLGWGAGKAYLVLFIGALLGFAVKVPLWPFHTWLPLTYSEAPTPVSMVLTGVMSKLGVYGFLRLLLPIFPEPMQALLTPLLWLAVATVVLSAFAALAQRDLKRILAYSSINHLGYCLLGVFAAASAAGTALDRTAALNGVVLQMFNHGITASLLFCFVAFIEERSNGTRGLEDFGGLRKVAPIFCGLMGIALFSSLGLPGLNGFIGEFLVFKGVFPLVPWAAVLALPGLLVTAIFILTLIQKVWCGPLNEKWARFTDLTYDEITLILPSTLLMFVLGIWPQFVIAVINPTVVHWVRQLPF